MRFTSPAIDHRFAINADATMPPLIFTTDSQGPHEWRWSIRWRTFNREDRVETPGNRVDLAASLVNLGGSLTVIAQAGRENATIPTSIIGTNPGEARVRAYLAGIAGGPDFVPIVLHEANGRHFNNNGRNVGQPIVSFDGGYGIVQLTNPAPTYEQAWNWQRNIDAGMTLFAQKRADAIRHLGQGSRTYTADQLRLEAVARWNGGAYHRWDGRAWIRNPDIVCAPGTGNIGWDMTNAANAGQTVQELLARDGARFNQPPRRGVDHYRYSGICYADNVVG